MRRLDPENPCRVLSFRLVTCGGSGRSALAAFIHDGFVKSPSVPLEAGLRCNFVVAAPEGASLLSFCAPCIVGARGACPISGAKHRAPTIEAIGLATFYEIIIHGDPD
jgi:hypothetical protein